MAIPSPVPSEEDPYKVPPQSLDAEMSVLGGILIDGEAIHKVVDLLGPQDFYKRSHNLIYKALLSLYQKSEPVDVISLANELTSQGDLDKVGGSPYLGLLAASVPSSANIIHYAKIVREKSIMRTLINAATDIVTQGYDGAGNVEVMLDDAEKAIFEITANRFKRPFYSVREIVKDAFKNIEELYENKEKLTGLTTGFNDLDKITCGLQKADLIIVAGRPSMGKTAFALNLALNTAVSTKKAVAIFSLEMSKESLVNRLLCAEAGIDSSKLRGGFLRESDWPKLTRAASQLSEAPLFIDDTAEITPLEMRAKARRLIREHDLGLVVVDYLQLMRSASRYDSNREREISEISRSMKSLAKELNIPVIALSQLNRSLEGRQDKRPMLSDLRESGAIEQDADLITFIYRDEVYNANSPDAGIAEVIVGKHRNGPTGVVRLKFFKEFTRFENLEEHLGDNIPSFNH